MAASVSPTRKVHCYFINHSYIPLANPSTLYAIPSTHTFVQVEKLILADDRCAFLERDTQVDKEVLLFKPPPEMVTAFSRRAKYHFHEHKNDLQLIGRLETLSTVYTPEETVFIIILLPYAVPDPEQFFVGVTRQGPLREEDVYRNGIGEPEQVDERVLAFCAALAKPRKIPKEIYDRIDAEDDKSPIFNELLESADDLPNGTHGQTRLSWNYEADLYLSLSRYGKRDTMFDGAKGSVMNSKFFMPLAESLKARNVDTNRNFTCLFSGRSWPFGYRLICRLLDRLVSFTPRSDNSVWIGQLPMFISETYSEGGSDLWRLLVQAAVLVRLFNANKEGVFFVFPAIYIDSDFIAIVRYFYCVDLSPSVFIHKTEYDLRDSHETLAFAVLLFNLADVDPVLLPHSRMVPKFLARIDTYGILSGSGSRRGASSRSKVSRTTRTARSQIRGNQAHDIRKHSTLPAYLPPAKRAKTSPPIVFPPALTTAGYIPRRILRRSKHSSVFIARKGPVLCIIKKVKQESAEVAFFNMCHHLHLANIIQPEMIISDARWNYIVLPFFSVFSQVFLPGGDMDVVRPHLLSMTYDLAEALAALHSYGIAHRDIKTDNLVFDDHFRLFLIDFEQTITIASEEEKVADPCGTRYWSAPEVTEGLYSPIRADRYSCGLVFDAISEFAWLDPATVTELKQFSRQLRATDPKTRPPLSKWCRSTNHRVLFSPPE